MLHRRRRALVVAGLFGIVILTIVGSKMAGGRRPTYSVDTVIVEPTPFRVAVSAQGTVEPISTLEARSQVAGRVAEVLVEEGDAVEAGREIVRLDQADLLAQLQQARAAIASAEAELAQYGAAALGGGSHENGGAKSLEVQQAEAQLAVAKARLAETERGPSEAQVAQARAQLVQAETALEDAERNLEVMQALYEKGAVAKSAVDEATTRLINARAADDSARRQYDVLLSSPTAEQSEIARAQVREAEIALAMALERESSREKGRQAAAARLEQARANLALVQAQLARTSVVAPGDGTVISVPVKKGAVVVDGMPVATLARAGGVRVRARVDETDIAAVAVGQEVIFTTDALVGTELRGRVAEIAPSAITDGSAPRIPVLIDVDGAPPALLPGMSADVEIVTYARPDAAVVPLQAVIERDGEKVVFVVDPEHDTARETAVEIGHESLMEAEVLKGVKPGDEVIVGDSAVLKRLKDGDRVKRGGKNEPEESDSGLQVRVGASE